MGRYTNLSCFPFFPFVYSELSSVIDMTFNLILTPLQLKDDTFTDLVVNANCTSVFVGLS